MIKVEYITFGIACRIKDKIYMNKNLLKKKHKKLHDAILDHEEKHSSGFKKMDVINDFNNFELEPVKREYSAFVLGNPTTWVEFLPFWFYGGRIAFSIPMTLIWLITITLGVLPWII